MKVFAGDKTDVVRLGAGLASDYTGAEFAGGAGDDTLVGGIGNDALDGGPGDDLIQGVNGHDSINGGGGTDEMRMEKGSGAVMRDGDTDADANRDKFVAGAKARPLVSYSTRTQPITVDLAAASGEDTLVGIRTVAGGSAADTLLGGDGRDVLKGGKGNDVFDGRGGNDRLSGGAGDDSVSGGDDNDTVDGGDGQDDVDGGAGADHLSGGDGNDLVKGGAGDDEFVVEDGEFLDGQAAADQVDCGDGTDHIGYHDVTDRMDPSCERISIELGIESMRPTPAVTGNVASFDIRIGFNGVRGTAKLLAADGSELGTGTFKGPADTDSTLNINLNDAGRALAAAGGYAQLVGTPEDYGSDFGFMTFIKTD